MKSPKIGRPGTKRGDRSPGVGKEGGEGGPKTIG